MRVCYTDIIMNDSYKRKDDKDMTINEAYSSVAMLSQDMQALEYAKACNRRFGIVHELSQIVKEDARLARERILKFAFAGLGNAVTA